VNPDYSYQTKLPYSPLLKQAMHLARFSPVNWNFYRLHGHVLGEDDLSKSVDARVGALDDFSKAKEQLRTRLQDALIDKEVKGVQLFSKVGRIIFAKSAQRIIFQATINPKVKPHLNNEGTWRLRTAGANREIGPEYWDAPWLRSKKNGQYNFKAGWFEIRLDTRDPKNIFNAAAVRPAFAQFFDAQINLLNALRLSTDTSSSYNLDMAHKNPVLLHTEEFHGDGNTLLIAIPKVAEKAVSISTELKLEISALLKQVKGTDQWQGLIRDLGLLYYTVSWRPANRHLFQRISTEMGVHEMSGRSDYDNSKRYDTESEFHDFSPFIDVPYQSHLMPNVSLAEAPDGLARAVRKSKRALRIPDKKKVVAKKVAKKTGTKVSTARKSRTTRRPWRGPAVLM